jgi:hypothetical protein
VIGRVLLGLVAALALGDPSASAAADERAAPLEVPTAPLPAPESLAGGDVAARVDAAAAAFRSRGYAELPVLARALLDADARGADASLAERATALAPTTPAIAYEVAWRFRRPLEGLRSLWLLSGSFPALVWLLTWGGVALGLGVLASAAAVAVLAFARTATLHGHALAHRLGERAPRAWPGALAWLSVLAALPLLDLGPAVVVAVAGSVSMTRLRVREAATVGTLIALVGLLLSKPLDEWARLASLPAHAPQLAAAWRVERGQPLPRDLRQLESAQSQARDDLVTLALATAAKRAGDLARTDELAASLGAGTPPALRARAANLLGISALARGDTRAAIDAFERADRGEASAAFLYNLSQAHGRALHLPEQTTTFAAAKSLDPELVSRQAGNAGVDVHRYLLESPAPVSAYLARAFVPAPEADALADSVRRALLGSIPTERGWLALPGLALLGLLLRRSGISRCPRCMRVACARCSGPAAGDECVRCARLFDTGGTVDARVRREQIDRDRRAQRWLGHGLAVAGALLPGSAAVLRGRMLRGALALLVASLAAAAWLAAPRAPVPAELGRLATDVPLGLAALLAAPLWLGALARSFRRSVRGGAR